MKLAGKSCLVTGGAGLIGSCLVDRLCAVGASVVIADDFSKGRLSNLKDVSGRIEIREGDLEDFEAMRRALEGVDIVFHLASRAYGVGYSAGRHLDILAHNERITDNLVQALARKPVEWLFVTSSSCVYPDDGPDTVPELPLYTGEPEMANWGYGWAKRMLEQKALMLARETAMPLTIARPFNIYGERYAWMGEASQAIPMLVKKVMGGDDPVVVWGSGTQRRNYLHAVDCADAMAGLVEAEFRGAVNIGTEETVTMLELVRMICEAAGRHPQWIADRSKPEGRRIKSADSTLLRRAYPGFRRSVAMEEGLRRMCDWYRAEFPKA